MKTLYILRHAKAAPEDREGDAGRPLMKRGRKAAAAMGEYLGKQKPRPKLILCSSAVRTRETLDQMLPSLGSAAEVHYEDKLYLAGAPRLLDRLHRLPEHAESVLLVGHNPGLQELVAMLASEADGLADGFPTAALAVLNVSGDWAALRPHQAKLLDYKTPKTLSPDPDLDSD